MQNQSSQPERPFSNSLRGIQKRRKNLTCSICNKTFSRSDNLRTHQRIHTGEMPYACRFCGKDFRWKSALSNHEDLHEVNIFPSPTQHQRPMPRTPPPSPEYQPNDENKIKINIKFKEGKCRNDVIMKLVYDLRRALDSNSSAKLSADIAELQGIQELGKSNNNDQGQDDLEHGNLNYRIGHVLSVRNVPNEITEAGKSSTSRHLNEEDLNEIEKEESNRTNTYLNNTQVCLNRQVKAFLAPSERQVDKNIYQTIISSKHSDDIETNELCTPADLSSHSAENENKMNAEVDNLSASFSLTNISMDKDFLPDLTENMLNSPLQTERADRSNWNQDLGYGSLINYMPTSLSQKCLEYEGNGLLQESCNFSVSQHEEEQFIRSPSTSLGGSLSLDVFSH